MTIQQNVRCGLFRSANVQLAQIREIGNASLPASMKNFICSDGANAGYAQQLRSPGSHDFQWRLAQVPLCPGAFGIDVRGQVAIEEKIQVMDTPAIVTQQETGLVQAKLAQGIG